MRLRFLIFSIASLILIVSFTSCKSDLKDNLTKDQILQLLSDVNRISQEHKAYFQENEAKDILQQFDSLMRLVQDDTPSLLELYNQAVLLGLQDDLIPPLYSELFSSVKEIIGCDQYKMKGDYTWNTEAQHWELYKEDDCLSFQFPANSDGELVVIKFELTELFDGIHTSYDWDVRLYKVDEWLLNLSLSYRRLQEEILKASFNLAHPECGIFHSVFIDVKHKIVDFMKYLTKNKESFLHTNLSLHYNHFSIEDYIQGECSYIRSPLQINGTFYNPDFFVKLDYDLEEFLKFSSDDEVAPYANEFLQADFVYTPSEKTMVETTWYFNSYQNMLEPFLHFDSGDTEPLTYYYPYIQILFVEDSTILY